MVAKRHKITNVPLFKKLWDIIFFFGQSLNEPFQGILNCPKRSASDCPAKKKIMSRSFLNSGTLIVIVDS